MLNKITNAPLDNALVTVAGTESRTDKNGQTTIVLPADKSTISGTVTGSGYNSASVTVQITTKPVSANTFELTPAGQIYFLSNASGNIDVVKTNLDGTGRQTVLAGTGSEDPNNTLLLATRDWKDLALLSQRSGTKASLYLISTSDDKLSVIDSGNADFTPIGWYNHYFLYDVVRNSVPTSQTGHEELKSYNADTGQVSIIDQSQVQIKSGNSYYANFSDFNIMDNELAYFVQWEPVDPSLSPDNTGLQDALRTVLPSGGSTQTRKTFSTDQTNFPPALLCTIQTMLT